MNSLINEFFNVIKKIENSDIQYMVVGSIASIIYGEPRMTHDLDIVVNILPGDAKRLEQIFPKEQFYCPPIEIIKSEIVSHGQFSIIEHDSGLKIDFVILKNSEHALCEFKRKARVPFLADLEINIATPEDIIIKKLEFYREGESFKHIRDIRGILSETSIDYDYLYLWIDKLDLKKQWQQVQGDK
jgi:hypothetical protein